MKTLNLQINPTQARQIYSTAPAELKAILDESAPAGFFSHNVTDRVKSYEDACADVGIEPMDEKEMLRMGFRQDEIDRRKLETITFALNDQEYMDWTNSDQRKYYPWFDFSAPSGFAFGDTNYGCSYAAAGYASRLCFKSEELARYAGRQFADLYKNIIDNRPRA